jgi:hypothetical protein
MFQDFRKDMQVAICRAKLNTEYNRCKQIEKHKSSCKIIEFRIKNTQGKLILFRLFHFIPLLRIKRRRELPAAIWRTEPFQTTTNCTCENRYLLSS